MRDHTRSSRHPAPGIDRRAYQTRAVRDLAEALTAHRRIVAVGPAGCGKTVVAAMLVKRHTVRRVLFVAHKYELVDQAHGRLEALGVQSGVIMAQDEALHGSERIAPGARVQVASIQTAARRGAGGPYELIVVDEAHRIMADSYQALVAAHPKARVLGLTATPERMDGKSLGDFFERIVTIAAPSRLYAAGYLARPTVYVAPDNALVELTKRLKGAEVARGDYSQKALARIVDSGLLVGHVVSEAQRLAGSGPKVVFAGSVEHSQEVCARFRRAGVKAEHLDADTDPHERVRMLDGLRTGAVSVVSNFGVLTEGWDLPALGAVIIARPTRSKTLLFQMAGRVQRPWKGRKPVVLDHGNCCLSLGIDPRDDYSWSLDMRAAERAHGDAPVKACDECRALIPTGCATCPECGAAQPKTERQLREEEEAKLVELETGRLAALRARIDAVAQAKGAPSGWAEYVFGAAAAR